MTKYTSWNWTYHKNGKSRTF